MENTDLQYLRDVVERTHPPAVNHYWSVPLAWGAIITAGYLLCAFLGATGRTRELVWVWPILIFAIAWPLQVYLIRRVRSRLGDKGIRPRPRKDLAICWIAISAIGFLWSAGLAITGMLHDHWNLLPLLWSSLCFIGYIVNGVLLSKEWLWAAGVLFASIVAVFLAGPSWYWAAGLWLGLTYVIAGFFGRRNAALA